MDEMVGRLVAARSDGSFERKKGFLLFVDKAGRVRETRAARGRRKRR